ncbi:MAG: Family 2 glycosyl transferase [Candidatus Magasanikbacteria bacterium GW2011_GWA2_37_8]|uniref:Family 2 glycosyl transferase n=1 Tax=Candidatus Magasanikbacteria bacterium GW2011_GWA2_37_8 TaxID=1619036 RepID=A0A0G0HM96_9BACT|nr:MAG: Family 2 glycosyl transferase [Candidatus Magasanikbacteria bacterium GW2011_GWA2_37_8]
MKKILSKLAFLLFVYLTLFVFIKPVFAADDLQAQIDAANQQISILNQQIANYQTKLNETGAEKKTLQSAVSSLDLQRKKVETQVTATQNQIKATELQIKQLGSQINNAKDMILAYKDDLARSLREINQSEGEPIVAQLLAIGGFANFWQNVGDNLQLQNVFQKNLRNLQTEKKNLTNRQNATEQKKEALAIQNKALAVQRQSLASTVKAKKQLLAETKNNEANYQKLLANAKAQLKSFSDFTKNAGGAKLLGNQTICDSWGCYYNQRDSSWGAQSLNGTEYTLASDGCLVTAVAMVITHYGYQNITPASINANPDNFASYYPAFLMKTVVLVSGQKGNYIMRDPYLPNGKDINFSDHYSVKGIYSIETVVIR